MASGNEHPSPQHLIAHFLATVEDYERLREAYPLPGTISFHGHGDDDLVRWIVILHALLLRKYFATKDQLLLANVARALRTCATAPKYANVKWEALYQNVGRYDTATVYGSERLTETQVLNQYLYGRYLHGDFGKWAATEGNAARLPDDAFWLATHARANRVLLLAYSIRAGIEEGSIAYETPST